jgi:hypothetical protein
MKIGIKNVLGKHLLILGAMPFARTGRGIFARPESPAGPAAIDWPSP